MRFSDALWTSMTWEDPVPSTAPSAVEPTPLVGYSRIQSFRVWLVALHELTGRVVLLGQVDWSVGAEVSIDPTRPRGRRARVERVHRPQPVLVPRDRITGIPSHVLGPPIANEAQELWWTPAPGEPGVRTRIRASSW